MELTTQPEKAYLKQNQIFLGNKRLLLQKDADKHETLTDEERRKIRYWKNVGLGFETPRAAIEGEYIDKKCPFTGNVRSVFIACACVISKKIIFSEMNY